MDDPNDRRRPARVVAQSDRDSSRGADLDPGPDSSTLGWASPDDNARMTTEQNI